MSVGTHRVLINTFAVKTLLVVFLRTIPFLSGQSEIPDSLSVACRHTYGSCMCLDAPYHTHTSSFVKETFLWQL